MNRARIARIGWVGCVLAIFQAQPAQLSHSPRERVEVLKPTEFTLENLQLLAERLRTEGPALNINWYISNGRDRQCVLGLTVTDDSFEYWRRQWAKCAADFDVARVSSLRHSAVLEARFRDGRRIRRVIGSADPLRITGGFGQLRIAHVTESVTSNHGGNAHSKEFHVYLYAAKLSPTKPDEIWLRVLEALRSHLGSAEISFVIRSDFLFRGLGLPLTFPFARNEPVPALLTSYGERELFWCVADPDSDLIRCGGLVNGRLVEPPAPLVFPPSRVNPNK